MMWSACTRHHVHQRLSTRRQDSTHDRQNLVGRVHLADKGVGAGCDRRGAILGLGAEDNDTEPIIQRAELGKPLWRLQRNACPFDQQQVGLLTATRRQPRAIARLTDNLEIERSAQQQGQGVSNIRVLISQQHAS